MNRIHHRQLYLVRHGQTDLNIRGIVTGQLDPHLNTIGRKQAECAAKYLSNLTIETLYSSDLIRAVETAKIIGKDKDVEIVTTKALREANFSEFQGASNAALQHDDDWNRRRTDIYNFLPRGGESYIDVEQRVLLWLHNVKEKTAAAVTHGGVLRVMSVLANRFDRISVAQFNPRHGSIWLVHVSSGRPIQFEPFFEN